MKIKQLVKKDYDRVKPIGEILSYYIEITKWQTNGSVLMEMHKQYIVAFMKKYSAKCESTRDTLNALNDEYFTPEDAENKPKLKEGLDIKEYNEKVKNLMEELVEFSV